MLVKNFLLTNIKIKKMKANLEKELIRNQIEAKRSLGFGTDSAVNQVKALLEYKTNEDSFIMNNLGLNSLNAKIQEDKGKLIVMEQIEKATKFTVINQKVIKDLCLRYRLRLLPTKHYIGAFPPDITTEIKELEKNKAESHNRFTRFDAHQLQSDFYVLAPPSMFKLDKIIKEPKQSIVSKFMQALQEEPILFYKESDDHYVLLKKWGDDFTIFRRILGFFTGKEENAVKSMLFIAIFASILVNCFIKETISNHFLISGLTLLAFIAISALICCFVSGDSFTENNWNKNTE